MQHFPRSLAKVELRHVPAPRLRLPLPTRLIAHALFASALPEDRVAKKVSAS